MSAPFRLRVVDGPQRGQDIAVTGTSLTLGRHESNDIVLDDPRVSRRHARLEVQGDRILVTDLGSANGTRVNGRRIEDAHFVQPGDVLQLGESRLRLEQGQAPALAAPSEVAGLPVPHLIAQLGEQAGQVYPLDRATLTIGRHESCDIVLDDKQASRQHARFYVRDGEVTVTDLGSAHGVKVNGQAITGPTRLNAGDVLLIGTSVLKFEAPASQPSARTVTATIPAAARSSPTYGQGLPLAPPPAPGVAPPVPPHHAPAGAPPLAPPAPPTSRRRPWVVALAGGLAALLLLGSLLGVGTLALRGRLLGQRATPTAAPASTSTSTLAAPPLTGSPPPGSGGANPAPPPPGTTPTLALTPTAPPPGPTTAPTRIGAAPALPPAAAGQPTPGQPATGGRGVLNGRVYTNQRWGFQLTLPTGWTKEEETDSHVTFVNAGRRAAFSIVFGPAGTLQDATQRLRQELQATARLDPAFQPEAVPIDPSGTLGGQPAAKTAAYRYTQSNGIPVTEADVAVVLAGKAAFLFAALAPVNEFDAHVDEFNALLNSVVITGP